MSVRGFLLPVVVKLPAQVADDLMVVGGFRDHAFYSTFDFGGGEIFEARLEFVSGGEGEFGSELSGLGMFVGVETVDRPQLHQQLFLMPLRAVPPPPDKVHGTDVL